MNEVSERIAKLSPEKRALLLQRLSQKATSTSTGNEAITRTFVPERDQNYQLEVMQPGNLDRMAFKVAPRRAPGRGEVEIQAYAWSLNFRDIMIALGIYPTAAGMSTKIGSDFAGVIVALGPNVEGLRVGDEVIALASGFSAFVTTSAPSVAPKPSFLSFEQAATIPTVFLTAYFSLHRLACLSKGERVLIHSATGGVGLAAVQIAQWLGAEIFATAGTQEKRDFLRSMGIQHISNSRSLDFIDDFRKDTNGEGVDVILNSLAGEAIPKSFTLLRFLGRFIEIGKRDIYQNSQLGLLPFRKALSFHAVELGLLFNQRPSVFRSIFTEVLQLLTDGTFKPLPTRTFPVSEISSGFSYMAQGTHIGKIAFLLRDQEIPITP